MAESLLLVQAAATLAMVGLIWFVQVVHYPLFGQVGREDFAAYERAHQSRTTIVVAPLMLVEAVTAVLLLWLRPQGISLWAAVAGAMLVCLVWGSTYLWQVPAHTRLTAAFNASDHRWLVRSNWIRTAGWTARGLLICWMIGQMLTHAKLVTSTQLATHLP